MEANISVHQLNQLVDYIKKTHTAYGPKTKDGKLVFDILGKSTDLKLGHKKPIIPFRKILFSNLLNPDKRLDTKIALIGLNNCDIWSLHYLLEEFEKTNLLPQREDFIIFGSDCLSTDSCFCGLIGTNKIAPFDLYIQEEKTSYSIFSGSETGKKLLEKNGMKQSAKKLEINKIQLQESPIAKEKFSKLIDDKKRFEKFWKKISDNCFGCGACSMVCPLCFCTRRNFKNELTGESKRFMQWDSCFAKRFSEIQNHLDLRPQNADRLYNWYHHKFVRSYFKSDRFLCTGCGRCIEACPANLNMKNIIQSVILQAEKNEKHQGLRLPTI